MAHIFNLSVENGIVPNKMKIAKVIPIFKGGSTEEIGNYRPVSLLPICSKILEKLMYNRIIEFLHKSSFFYENQYGFRKNHSTSLAISELINDIQNNLENGNLCVAIFLDLKKAFDTVKHEVLLRKLDHIGVRGVAKDWFKSYLSDRCQFVQLSNNQSEFDKVCCGVPQGSILGPLLFLIYVNDMHKGVSVGKIRLFADDTCILYSGKCIHRLIEVAESELISMSDWFKINFLAINVKKSNFMIIRSKQKKLPEKLKIKFDNQTIDECSFCKYLGVIIDNHISWKKHIEKVCSKVSAIVGVMFKTRNLMPFRILRQVYFSLIHCHMNYCIEAWGTAYQSVLKPLITLQKRAIRTITFSGFIDHTEELFKLMDILPLNKQVFYNICIMVFKEIKNISCSKFGFSKDVNATHKFNTRQSKKFQVVSHRTNYFCQSISHCGKKFYNMLPDSLTCSYSIDVFKCKLYKWLKENTIDLNSIILPHRYK